MPFCNRCGSPLDTGVKFCSNCGAQVGQANSEPQYQTFEQVPYDDPQPQTKTKDGLILGIFAVSLSALALIFFSGILGFLLAIAGFILGMMARKEGAKTLSVISVILSFVTLAKILISLILAIFAINAFREVFQSFWDIF